MPDLLDLRDAFDMLEREIPDGYRSRVVDERLARLPGLGKRGDSQHRLERRPEHRRRNVAAAVVAAAVVVALAVVVAALTRSGGNHAQVGGQPSTNRRPVAPNVVPTHSSKVTPGRGPTISVTPGELVVPSRDFVRFVTSGAPVLESDYQRGAARSGEPLRPTRGILEFTTPSGNISCGLSGSGNTAGVACEVRTSSFATPPRPASCHLNWGASWLSIESGRLVRGLCLGGPPFDPVSTVLPYGNTISRGTIACHSESNFLACADVTTGHGFLVNRTRLTPY